MWHEITQAKRWSKLLSTFYNSSYFLHFIRRCVEVFAPSSFLTVIQVSFYHCMTPRWWWIYEIIKKGLNDSLPTIFFSFRNDIGRNDVHWPVFDRRRQSMKRYMFSEPVNYVWLLLTMKNVFFFLLLFFICCITNIKKINPCLCKIYEKFRFSVKRKRDDTELNYKKPFDL